MSDWLLFSSNSLIAEKAQVSLLWAAIKSFQSMTLYQLHAAKSAVRLAVLLAVARL